MKELMLEVESLEERIAPWCCDCGSLATVNANPTVNVSGNDNQLNTGPQDNVAFVAGSNNNTQQTNNQANAFDSVFQSTNNVFSV
jgi:hypothetical protein